MSALSWLMVVSTRVAAALGAHDQAGADLPQLDHVGHLDHAVEQPQAGVGDVVDHAVRGQAEAMMDAAGRGRLEEVAADRAVDQGADVPPVDPGGRDAFSAVSMLCSLGSVPGGQNRRWRMPVINSSRPSGSRSRR